MHITHADSQDERRQELAAASAQIDATWTRSELLDGTVLRDLASRYLDAGYTDRAIALDRVGRAMARGEWATAAETAERAATRFDDLGMRIFPSLAAAQERAA